MYVQSRVGWKKSETEKESAALKRERERKVRWPQDPRDDSRDIGIVIGTVASSV